MSQVRGTSFGIDTSGRSFVVLDKSFLQGVNPTQLRYYADKGWIFGIPDVLWYEPFHKRDDKRTANVLKLRSIESSLRVIPRIGQMFQAEVEHLEPASRRLRVKYVQFNKNLESESAFDSSLETAKSDTRKWEKKLPQMVEIWRDFKKIPTLRDAKPAEIKDRVEQLKILVRDDHDDMRGFYRNHKPHSYPDAELLDEEWALYRWTQANLLAGLDYFVSYGPKNEANREKLMHELLDVEYLICAVLVGGLASRDDRIVERFRLLRPDGVLLR
jgi:hypothetical protein